MTHGRQPRKPRWQRTPDTLLLAASRASKPPADDVAAIIDALKACFQALRTGTISQDQYTVLTGAVVTARAIERQGVITGLASIISDGDQALDAVWQRITRSGTWGRTALYAGELDAIRVFVTQHIFQIRQLSRSEYLRAIDSARGSIGPTGLVLTSPEKMRELSA